MVWIRNEMTSLEVCILNKESENNHSKTGKIKQIIDKHLSQNPAKT